MKVWVALAAASLAAVVWAAQQNPTQPPKTAVQSDELTRIQADVTRVNMLFTVMDRKGRFVTDLGKNDFEVIENKRPQTIQEFTAETDLPLRLGVLIDTSNSIRDRFKFEQEAASEFVRTVMRSHQDRGLVVGFSSRPEMIMDLVDDTTSMERSIYDLRPGGGTALYDAVYFACRDKLGKDQPMTKFRRAIVILSDGDDNESHYTRDQALEMAQRNDVVVYTISTNISRVESDGDKVLRYFAKETGGTSYFPFKVEDLSQSFENIANVLTHQYIILYKPDPLITDGLFHPVVLRVKGRKDLQVRVRPGYYAPKM
ncbi:MAG TPA: VWA domain-containing protein [Candidatus Limnocylindrales bacterium]|nr:VWA domain-containing protein [Candidatus Limnocylindrales bacterium]